jgi:metal-responsive CopG/Arc/MetJ family transcriptional regulator
MKTTVSIPDSIFEAGEALSQNLGISRSELYARALKAFITSGDSQTLTEKLDRVYSKQPSGLDEKIAMMQFSSLRREEW